MKKTLALLFILVLAGFQIAEAHKVSIFAWVEDGIVHTESKFSGGKRVKSGKVEVYDSQGNFLLDGLTDENGAFSFQTPKNTGLKIVLSAGMGHGNSWTLSRADIVGGDTETAAAAQTIPVTNPDARSSSAPPASGLSASDVEAIVARQLERKLQPLTRMLVEEREKGPTAGDIFGGVGYILGLVGLGAYIRYRKDDRRS